MPQPEKKYIKEDKFTPTEVSQLLSYCEDVEREGWYYGNREQFNKRHKNIVNKLKSL